MAEEASEKLVRQYLENLGYLVISNRQYIFPEKKVKRNQPLKASADLIAVIKKKGKNIPEKLHKRMIIEVKGWLGNLSLQSHIKNERNRRSFYNICSKSGDSYKRANYLKKRIEEKYGGKFNFVLIVNDKVKNDKKLYQFLENNEITLLTFQNDIIPGLIDHYREKKNKAKRKEESEYENDPVSQLLRFLLYDAKKCKLCNKEIKE